ncbi:nitrous oxide-stimulated promoter family protein [Providencia alcalifaciens]|uniref:nitrous oxide-stimulated promoter family protein n=1 Tax=Providencia TaxID=586 RepID=UPI0015EB2E2A|nr:MULTISPECIES: nitrous oxide-stimulated promoter family protein [Providencia]QLQ96400.1 nitrous oxide-stimulated promoter family protein [Providencia alcalifaciens]
MYLYAERIITVGKRISREIVTIEKMIKIYEKSHPAPDDNPEYYQTLFSYAVKRLEKCRYGEAKPACKQCPIHCYQPKQREQMKIIMRWAGPKMLYSHPILAICHLIDDRKPVPELPPRNRATSKLDK